MKVHEVDSLKAGTPIRILPHTTYHYQTPTGSTLDDPIVLQNGSYETSVVSIIQDEWESADGKPMIEFSVEDATGRVHPIERVELL